LESVYGSAVVLAYWLTVVTRPPKFAVAFGHPPDVKQRLPFEIRLLVTDLQTQSALSGRSNRERQPGADRQYNGCPNH